MAVPTYAWVAPTAALVDQDSGVTVTDWEARRRRQITIKELLYGTGSFVGTIPHRHVGTEDALVSAAHTQNLVAQGCPDDATEGNGLWTRSGYEIEANKGFRTTTTSGHYAWQTLCLQAATSKAAFGAGADCVVSIFVRSKETVPSAGELHFGLADGGTTFKTGCKGVIAFGSITSSHQRFYMPLAAATTGSWTTDCRILIRNHTTPPNQKLVITGIAVSIGSVLVYWSPCYLESEAQHENWKRYGLSDCPIYDERVAITDAIHVTGA